MKKLIVMTLSILAVCVGINIVIAYATDYSEEEDVSAEIGNKTYVIREYEGMVACFEQDSDEPFLVTETAVRNLPPTDRKMLAGGVEVVGSRALSRALEDYRS